MIAEHRAAGTRMERLTHSQVVEKEPTIGKPPSLAAWAPGDFALEPGAFARQLLAGALAAGASVRQGTVEAVEATGNRITGVVVDGKKLPADIVVLATGNRSRAIALTVGVDLPIHESPAVLLRFGALLGTQILFTEPGLFSDYILGSPSLWYDKRHALTLEAGYAKQNQDLRANVYLYVGAFEALRKGDRRYNQTVDMVADNRALEAALQSRKYPSLKLKSAVLNDDDHLTVAPRGFTRGLKYLLPVR